MANDKLYITISNKSGTGGGSGRKTKTEEEKLEEAQKKFENYLVTNTLNLIKSKTFSAIDKAINRIGTFKGDYISSREAQYAMSMVKQTSSIISSAVAGATLGGGIGAIAGATFAFSSIIVDNVQDMIDYNHAYNMQQYEIDLMRQRSGLNSTTNESRTGD